MNALDWSLPQNRTYDRDGRVRCADSCISKSTVSPYRGREIVDWQRLGLQPDAVYYLYRPRAELVRAAKSFNAVPLLDRHTDEHDPSAVVGCLGTDARVVGDALKCSLSIWARRALDGLEYGNRSALSAAYDYTPVMVPGVTADGRRYDGQITEMQARHVALINAGRVEGCRA
jgi:hypothetical protein